MSPSPFELDPATRTLLRLSVAIAAGSEATVRAALTAASAAASVLQIEELVLQSYLFCGFPRALNAAREWRRIAPEPAPMTDEADDDSLTPEWRARGEQTCAAVYGRMYDKLRLNVRDLHPALDSWMVVDGYGKVLSRPGLDLKRRELCVVAACIAMDQDRQLHSHLHGSLSVGVEPDELYAAIDAIAELIGEERTRSVRLLLARVLGK